MKISGHKTRSVFDRYNITSEEDLKEAATKLGDYIQRKKVTLMVTPDDSDDQREDRSEVELFERLEEKLVPPTRIERAARGLGNEGQKHHYPRKFNYFKHFSFMRSGQE